MKIAIAAISEVTFPAR